jgi:hypothetical protein
VLLSLRIFVMKETLKPREFKSILKGEIIGFPQVQKEDIMSAYDFSLTDILGKANAKPDRTSKYGDGFKYTALFLIGVGVKNPVLIKAALLNDAWENLSDYWKTTEIPNNELVKAAKAKFVQTFGEETAEIVMPILKPLGSDAKTAEVEYDQQLRNASEDSLLIKMAGILGNLHYSQPLLQEELFALVNNAQKEIPLFEEKVLKKYPKEGEIILGNIKREIHQLNVRYSCL